jgi:DNA recombination protein RmuC
MILDPFVLAASAAIASALVALVLFVLLLRSGGRLGAAQSALIAAQQERHALSIRLESLDAVRDELDFERRRTAELERQASSLTTRLEERERNLAELRQRLETEFRDMSQRLVRETGDALMREAAQTFEKQQLAARQDAEQYSRSVSDLLKPMRETLGRYEEGLREMRDHHKKAQGELTGQIETLARSAGAVQAETRSLAAALKAGPRTRGRWGETTLRNVVELAGLSAYCDFEEQRSVADDGSGRKQPDLVVKLPGERLVAVDSKVSLSDWLDAAAAETDPARREAMTRHGKSVWTHVQQLAAKDYAAALRRDGAIDFVIMFLPGETFFTAAIEARPTLFQDAYERGVLIATPTTLIAILKSIAHAWRQQKAGDSAREVAGMAQDLYESLRNTGSYLANLGKSLERSVGDYNKLIGNMERRVLPKARRFAELEMPGTEKPVDPVTPVDDEVRQPAEDRDLLFEPRVALSSR